MPGKSFYAVLIRFENGPVHFRLVALQPGKQGGTEIKTDPGIVIDNINDPFIRIENPGCCIRCIAFGGDTFIPVMIRICRILYFDFLKPGIFAWRLIKVAMDTDKTTHVPLPSQKSRRPDRLISGYSPVSFSQIIIFCVVMFQGFL